jgi:2,4-dienoyl-CoA reductase-like NADH-dependent reductase (Old Yellow Enzyme family)
MPHLFEQSKINGMILPNRFIRSATWEGLAADNGACTPKLIELMAGLAEGGVGLIITGHTYVRQDGKHSPWQLGRRCMQKEAKLFSSSVMAEPICRNPESGR